MRLTGPSTAALLAASSHLVNQKSVEAIMLKVNGATNGINEGKRSFLGAAADRAIAAGDGAPATSFLSRARTAAMEKTENDLSGAAEEAAGQLVKISKLRKQSMELDRAPAFIETDVPTVQEFEELMGKAGIKDP